MKQGPGVLCGAETAGGGRAGLGAAEEQGSGEAAASKCGRARAEEHLAQRRTSGWRWLHAGTDAWPLGEPSSSCAPPHGCSVEAQALTLQIVEGFSLPHPS